MNLTVGPLPALVRRLRRGRTPRRPSVVAHYVGNLVDQRGLAGPEILEHLAAIARASDQVGFTDPTVVPKVRAELEKLGLSRLQGAVEAPGEPAAPAPESRRASSGNPSGPVHVRPCE